MLGTRHDLYEVALCEVRSEHQEARQVKLSGGDGTEQRREALHESSCGNPAKCLVFRETELIDAVRVKARRCACAMNPALLDLGEVLEELREKSIRPTHERAGLREELG